MMAAMRIDLGPAGLVSGRPGGLGGRASLRGRAGPALAAHSVGVAADGTGEGLRQGLGGGGGAAAAAAAAADTAAGHTLAWGLRRGEGRGGET